MSTPPPLDREPRSVRHPWEPDEQFAHLAATDPQAWRRAVQLDRRRRCASRWPGSSCPSGEHAVLTWVSGWDVPTVAAIVSLLHRARRGPTRS
jgi:hypothetical protein